MHSNHRQEVEALHAGDIGAVVGLKNTITGDTLCEVGKTVVLEKMEFPAPVIEEAVEPKTKADQEKMNIALQKLAEEDPTFRVRTNPEVNTSVKVVVVVNMVTSGSASNQTKAKALNSSMLSLVVLFLENTLSQQKTA